MLLLSLVRRTRRIGSSSFVSVALVVAGFGLSGIALGAESGPTLRQAVEAALAHNPELGVLEFDFRANEAQRRQAELRTPLEVEGTVENFAGTGETSGLDSAEATLSISRVIELGGKREARIGLVDAGRDSLTIARQGAQLDVVAEVTRRFVAVAEAQQRISLAERALELSGTTAKAADARVRAGKAPHVEWDRSVVAEKRAQIELRSAQSGLDTARRSLAALWGADDGSLNGQALGPVVAQLFDMPAAGSYAALVARLDKNPDFLRFATEERLREAELRLAETQRRADLNVGGGVRRLQASRDFALVATVSMPLFAGRRAEAAIAEAAARRDAVGAERAAAMVKAKAELYALHRQLLDAIEVVQTLDAKLLPTMEEALRETEYAFERGRYSYLELVDAQREYLAIQSERIDASVAAQLLAVEIERLTNAPIAP